MDGYKFDLRIYVAPGSLMSINPFYKNPLRIYIYEEGQSLGIGEEGLVRLATVKY